MEILEREIEALEEELVEIAGEENGLTREMESLGAMEALSRRRLQRALAERREVERLISEEESRYQELQEAQERTREGARAALREIYKQSGLAGYAPVLALAEPADLMKGIQHLDALTRRQLEVIEEYRALRRESEETAARLQQRREALGRAVLSADRESRAHAGQKRRRTGLLRDVRREKALHLDAVAELRRSAVALERALREADRGMEPPVLEVDFRRLKGALPWPATGPVEVGFGTVRHRRFGTETPHPGLDIRSGPGEPVRAVAAGRVLFNRRFGGYGRTVVIDHGGRYLSVSARLAASLVQEGEQVLPGQSIGFAPEAEAEGKSRVYFEIRHEGKAVDPVGWLSRRRSGIPEGERD